MEFLNWVSDNWGLVISLVIIIGAFLIKMTSILKAPKVVRGSSPSTPPPLYKIETYKKTEGGEIVNASSE